MNNIMMGFIVLGFGVYTIYLSLSKKTRHWSSRRAQRQIRAYGEAGARGYSFFCGIALIVLSIIIFLRN